MTRTVLSFSHIALLFGGTLAGETMGSLVGGGSFVVQPTVLLAGLTIHQAVALDVTASCLTSVTGLATLKKAGRTLPARLVVAPAVAGMVGALLGPMILASISSTALAWGFALAAIAVAIGTLDRQSTDETDSPKLVALTISSLVLGVYTGLSGAGSGILAVVLLTRLGGMSAIGAVALRKVIFIPATIVAAASYVWHDLISWEALIPMATACALAGWLGTRLMLRIGNARMNHLFRFAALALAVTTIWSLANGS